MNRHSCEWSFCKARPFLLQLDDALKNYPRRMYICGIFYTVFVYDIRRASNMHLYDDEQFKMLLQKFVDDVKHAAAESPAALDAFCDELITMQTREEGVKDNG